MRRREGREHCAELLGIYYSQLYRKSETNGRWERKHKRGNTSSRTTSQVQSRRGLPNIYSSDNTKSTSKRGAHQRGVATVQKYPCVPAVWRMMRRMHDMESGETVRGRSSTWSVGSEEGKDRYPVIGVTSERNQSHDVELSASKLEGGGDSRE